MSGYIYLWSIEEGKDKSDPTNWSLEASGSLPRSITSNETDDWENSSTIPGLTVWLVDTDNTILSKPSDADFKEGAGTDDNWNDPIWRKSFLQTILTGALSSNIHNYNDLVGWRSPCSGILKSVGSAGYWTARFGLLNEPTSDAADDIGYYTTATLTSLSGEVRDEGSLI